MESQSLVLAKRRDDKRILKEALKQHVIQKALDDRTFTLERLDDIDMERDEGVIDLALKRLEVV